MLKEIYSKIRSYEIKIRKAIDSQMQGDFHSVFKGSGLEFDDVRQYQYGDDIRHIDWNVSAKGNGTFIKTFKEDKEQTVFFFLDVSASQQIGKKNSQKINIAKEICSVLALSAAKEGSTVGLLCYSDQKERYIKTGKGEKHAYLLMNKLFSLNAFSPKTALNQGLNATLSLLKRKALVVVISDFIDTDYERTLKATGQKHDL
jgi:uncharacterized protein (DUF58 family)